MSAVFCSDVRPPAITAWMASLSAFASPVCGTPRALPTATSPAPASAPAGPPKVANRPPSVGATFEIVSLQSMSFSDQG